MTQKAKAIQNAPWRPSPESSRQQWPRRQLSHGSFHSAPAGCVFTSGFPGVCHFLRPALLAFPSRHPISFSKTHLYCSYSELDSAVHNPGLMTVKCFIIYPFIGLEFSLETIPTWQNPPLSSAFQKLDTTISTSGTILTPQEFWKTGKLFPAIPCKDFPRMLECNSSQKENLNSLWSKCTCIWSFHSSHTSNPFTKVRYPSRSLYHSNKEAKANEKFSIFLSL